MNRTNKDHFYSIGKWEECGELGRRFFIADFNILELGFKNRDKALEKFNEVIKNDERFVIVEFTYDEKLGFSLPSEICV